MDTRISKTEKILDMLLLKLNTAKAQEIFKDVCFQGIFKETNNAFLQKKLISHSLSFQQSSVENTFSSNVQTNKI